MALHWRIMLTATAILACSADVGRAGEFVMVAEGDGITVNLDGQLFTRYLIKSGAKPILWPLVGPTGKEMTRAWPMREGNADEKTDHVHQRSFWFTHGSVNGISFWHEGDGHGDIVHREFLKVAGGRQGSIVTRNDWLDGFGKRICRDERRMRFGADETTRWIDLDVTLFADESPVTFGDTKEGCFGLRVAGTMDVEKKLGGRIVNAEGLVDDQAWGKPSPWVDYQGPVDGQRVGIAIFNHPTSFRYPTHWHVRTYGLFAANPFGLHDFYNDSSKDGSYVLEPGKSFTLKHRVVLHSGNELEAKIAEHFAAYAKMAETR